MIVTELHKKIKILMVGLQAMLKVSKNHQRFNSLQTK